MIREIKGVLALGPPTDWNVPVLRTEATTGEGVEELAAQINEHHDYIESAGTLAERRRRNLMNEVLGLATVRMRRTLEKSLDGDDDIRDLLDQVVERRLDPASAAERLLERRAK
jgi:LAO/AO transport system kinase